MSLFLSHHRSTDRVDEKALEAHCTRLQNLEAAFKPSLLVRCCTCNLTNHAPHCPVDFTLALQGENKHVLRLWLISAAAKLKEVDPARVWQKIETLLPASRQPEPIVKPFCLQLLQFVCEVEPDKVATTYRSEIMACKPGFQRVPSSRS